MQTKQAGRQTDRQTKTTKTKIKQTSLNKKLTIKAVYF
jgi:hypothetical protein